MELCVIPYRNQKLVELKQSNLEIFIIVFNVFKLKNLDIKSYILFTNRLLPLK